MIEVLDIAFPDHIAPVVDEFIRRLEDQIGKTHTFSNKGQKNIQFALRPPGESRAHIKRAYRLFLTLKSTAEGAKVIRPRVPKSGCKIQDLTSENIEMIYNAGLTWLSEVKALKVPLEHQDTENANVLAGGQFESSRRKH